MLAEYSILVECVLEQEAGYVAIGGIRHQRDDRSNRRVAAFGDLSGGGYRGSPAQAGGNSGVPGELSGSGGRVVLGDTEDLIDDLVCEVRTLEVGPQAVDLVRRELLAAQDRGIVGFDRKDLDGRILFFQIRSDT